MQHPENFNHPCNCFGKHGTMEGDVDFHEMGEGECKNDPTNIRKRNSRHSWSMFAVGYLGGAIAMYLLLRNI